MTNVIVFGSESGILITCMYWNLGEKKTEKSQAFEHKN
jgi:hypothetical protein